MSLVLPKVPSEVSGCLGIALCTTGVAAYDCYLQKYCSNCQKARCVIHSQTACWLVGVHHGYALLDPSSSLQKYTPTGPPFQSPSNHDSCVVTGSPAIVTPLDHSHILRPFLPYIFTIRILICSILLQKCTRFAFPLHLSPYLFIAFPNINLAPCFLTSSRLSVDTGPSSGQPHVSVVYQEPLVVEA